MISLHSLAQTRSVVMLIDFSPSFDADWYQRRSIFGSTKDWLQKLRTAITDAEDVLDKLQYQILQREIQQCSIEEGKILHGKRL
ncbi:hypothetical protein ACS0TY_003040 [Phlomoides rotata]